MLVVYAIIITLLLGHGQQVTYVADYADSKQECLVAAHYYQAAFPKARVTCAQQRIWEPVQ